MSSSTYKSAYFWFNYHLFNSPIVTVSGTVENSLTLPDGVSDENLKCYVYFSVAGKNFQLAQTYSNGPDWGYMYGKTGSVALFKGMGDTYYGTQSVKVYAVDQYGRKSEIVTRNIVYNNPGTKNEISALLNEIERSGEKNYEYENLLSKYLSS